MVKRIIGIYKITSPTGCIYIGQSIHILKRFVSYQAHNCRYQRRLQHSLNKYGWINHTHEILEECTQENLNQREIFYIKLYDSFNTKKGMNLISGGTGKGKLVSDETRAALSRGIKGTKMGKDNPAAKETFQYSVEGKFIQRFNSRKEASMSCGKDNDSSISGACRIEKRTLYGYQWKPEYLGECIPPTIIGSYARREKKRTAAYTKGVIKISSIDDSEIKRYASIKEACADNIEHHVTIGKSAKAIHKKLGTRGHYWRFQTK